MLEHTHHTHTNTKEKLGGGGGGGYCDVFYFFFFPPRLDAYDHHFRSVKMTAFIDDPAVVF